jgi:DNA invertase Pin-like site-specific DNA recombinase
MNRPTPPTGAPIRVATYTRTATTGRDAQARLALRQRLLYDAVLLMPRVHLVANYTDYGSGRRMSRPGLDRALADATARGYDVLAVDGYDRLSRDACQLLSLIERFARHGVTLHDITGHPRNRPSQRRPRRGLAGALSFLIGDFLTP